MARRRSGVNWTVDTLTPTLATLAVRANRNVVVGARSLAREIEAWMKENAPWQDRTRAARLGLHTFVDPQGFKTTIYLAHGEDVEHGFWLEVIQDGAYSIIVPALEHFDGANTWGHFAGIFGERG